MTQDDRCATAVDARRVVVTEALTRWLETRFAGPVRLRGTATSNGDGFDSEIYFVQVEGDTLPEEWRGPLVLRIKSSPEETEVAAQEAAVQTWLAERNYPTPRVLAVLRPGEMLDNPGQVMQRAPGVTMLASIVANPLRARSHVARLAKLSARLHRVEPEGFPAQDDVLERRLGLIRTNVEALNKPELTEAAREIDRYASRISGAPPVICHGDFHPLNVVVSGDRAAVIDWTDAGIGDRHSDVARTLVLFGLAPYAATNKMERIGLRIGAPMLVRMYRRTYDSVAPLDDERIALWEPIHLLHLWAQSLGVHAGLFSDGAAQANRADRIPQVLISELRKRFHARIAAIDKSP